MSSAKSPDSAFQAARRDIAWAIQGWTPEDRARLGALLERFGDAWSKGAASEGLSVEIPGLPPDPSGAQ